jgi:hypothetical protein
MTARKAVRPISTRDLLPSERGFVAALEQLGFGRLEFLRIHSGELVLDPWPMTVQLLKFSAAETEPYKPSAEFELKKATAALFEYIRSVDEGEIRCLEVRHGLPFAMEVDFRPDRDGGQHG